MDQIIIRKAVLHDLETLLQFEQGIIAAERPYDSTLKTGHINYYDLATMIDAPDVQVVVAETDGKIIASGYARIEKSKDYLKYDQYAYLGFMYVDAAYRGKGINAKIVDALSEWAVSQKITELRLQVYSDNIPAIKAYEKAGFTKNLVEMRMGL